MAEPLLVARGVTKRFGSVEALTDVDFEVDAGEVVALVGDNGAGKSTLIKTFSGAQPADEGEIRIAGQPVSIHSPADARRLGIATVYQDLALCDQLDVVANLFLGDEINHAGILDEAAMETRSRDLLRRLSVTTLNSVHAKVGSLSGGQRQSVAIARSLIGQPRIVILDEPTAALGVAQTEQVLHLIHRLREQGLAVIVISHNLDTVFDVADRIVVLRLGRLVGSFRAEATSRREIVLALLGTEEAPKVAA